MTTQRTEFSREAVLAAIRRGALNFKPAGPLAHPITRPQPAPKLAA